MIQRKIYIRKCLRLDTLCRIYNQYCAVAGSKTSRHLVIKIDMSGSIYQIENVFFSVTGLIYDSYGL